MKGTLSVELSADRIAHCTGGTVERSAGGAAGRVCTDSRRLGPGDLFVALRGPRFDGHAFLGEAFRRGAWGALVRRDAWEKAGLPGSPGSAIPGAVVAVDDTERGLGDLAACHRSDLEVKVVGVTGSNGKTTTKEMTASILGESRKVLRNEGNLNNLIGLPLTVLSLDETHEAAVLEMGMNHRGEIRRLAEIACPQVGVVTNVGPAHLEHLGSLEEVAAAKAELLEALAPRDTAVINADDPMSGKLVAAARCRIVTFGLSGGADFRGTDVRTAGDGTAFVLQAPGGRAEVSIPLLGEHNVRNALAAAAAALVMGSTPEHVAEGLRAAAPAPMRFTVLAFRGGTRVVNDAYNANPASMKAALDTFALLEGGRRRAAVLGEMRELGAGSAGAHRRLGVQAGACGFDLLVAVGGHGGDTAAGAASAGMDEGRIFTVPDAKGAADLLEGWIAEGDLVLLKGSRGVGLERVLDELLERRSLEREEL